LRIAAEESRAIQTAVQLGLLDSVDRLAETEIDASEREEILWGLGLRKDDPDEPSQL